MEGAQGAVVDCEGRRLVNFSSNDYLGLASHPEVVGALIRGVERYGVGAGASHLICGHAEAHELLERELAALVGREQALLFSTGYMANLGVIAALAGRNADVFEDRDNHASLLDGGLLSQGRLRRYPHANIGVLSELLAQSRAAVKLVVSDGVFSMGGDIAPLSELVDVCTPAGAFLVIDDAHGLGVLGLQGAGTAAHCGVPVDGVPILVGTLGKAFGTFGAFVAGTGELIEYLLQTARTYRYTTALPPALAEATRAALRLARSEDWRRDRLRALVGQFRAGTDALGLRLVESITPIQAVLIGGNTEARLAGEFLKREGFWVGAIRPPTVPVGGARLRITFSAEHTEQQVDDLLQALKRLPAECRPC
jgi:8-amino-7-oxononanoate synthase